MKKLDIHIHPYFREYGAEDLVRAMHTTKTNAAGLAGFNRDIFDEIRERFEKIDKRDFRVNSDRLVMKVEDNSKNEIYFPRTVEYKNKEGFHIIVVGGQKNLVEDALIKKNIEEALKQESLVIIDHPFVALTHQDIDKEKEEFLLKLCEEYSGRIALEWNGYCVPLLRNGIDKLFCAPLRIAGKNIKFSDVNKKLEDFVENIEKEGINCPIIADTDLHARSAKALGLIGKASIEADIKAESGRVFIDSLKEKVFLRDYKINKGYVDPFHFIFNYGIPVMLGKISKKAYESMKPRG